MINFLCLIKIHSFTCKSCLKFKIFLCFLLILPDYLPKMSNSRLLKDSRFFANLKLKKSKVFYYLPACLIF